MQLNTEIIVVGGRNRWVVIVDGVAEPGIGYGSKELAYARMNELWEQRSQSDRTMEALYVGRD
jgi:hypothetical protein